MPGGQGGGNKTALVVVIILIAVAAIGGGAFLLLGGDDGGSGPEGAAEDLLNAMQSGNCQQINELVTPELGAQIASAAGFESEEDCASYFEGLEFEIVRTERTSSDEELENGQATVAVELEVTNDPTNILTDGEAEWNFVENDEGQWQLSGAGGASGSESGEDSETTEEGSETTDSIPTGSIPDDDFETTDPTEYDDYDDGSTSGAYGPPTSPPSTDDPEFAALADECYYGSMAACDELYATTPYDSVEEEYGYTCGGRTSENLARECEATITDPILP